MRHRWVLQAVCWTMYVLAFLAMTFSNFSSIWGWGLYVLCITAGLILGQRVQRDNLRLLTMMWTLADELGYTAADLKRLAGKYGELDWAATRPERMTFLPGAKLIKAVTHKLQCEQMQRELQAKNQA